MFLGFVYRYILTAIRCSALAELVNGTIDYSRSPNSARYSYGTSATYQCNPGYNRTGGDSKRTCMGDGSTPSARGQWNGTAFQCSRMFYMVSFMSHK